MGANWFSKLASNVIEHDDLQDIRIALKCYSARRHASYAKFKLDEKDNGRVPQTPKENKLPTSVFKIKRRPGNKPLVEISRKPPKASNFDSNLAQKLTRSDTENHNFLQNHITSLNERKLDKTVTATQQSQSKENPILTKDMKRLLVNNDLPNCSSQEAWLRSYIRKYRTSECDESGCFTTHIIARFSPKYVDKPVPTNRYVEIEYKFNIKTNSEVFEKRGSLESLLPIPGSDSMDSLFDERVYQQDIDIFFQNFDYFINNLEGIVWWNGFNISASGHRDNRLPIHDFDMEPGKIVLSLEAIKEVNIIRDHLRLELRAEDLDGKLKWFRLKGDGIVSLLKITGPKDGTFIIEFPDYPLKPKAMKPKP